MTLSGEMNLKKKTARHSHTKKNPNSTYFIKGILEVIQKPVSLGEIPVGDLRFSSLMQVQKLLSLLGKPPP